MLRPSLIDILFPGPVNITKARKNDLLGLALLVSVCMLDEGVPHI